MKLKVFILFSNGRKHKELTLKEKLEIFHTIIMFKNYWKMSNKELEVLARKYNLQYFLEEAPISRNQGNPDFVINRKYIIDQLVQKDNRNIAFWAAVVSVIGAIISLVANLL